MCPRSIRALVAPLLSESRDQCRRGAVRDVGRICAGEHGCYFVLLQELISTFLWDVGAAAASAAFAIGLVMMGNLEEHCLHGEGVRGAKVRALEVRCGCGDSALARVT